MSALQAAKTATMPTHMLHTMLGVGNLERSLAFYVGACSENGCGSGVG